jgi:predicted signal transduction protein with EAL and GGDEF domain
MGLDIRSRDELMTDLTRALAPGSRERLLTVMRLHGLRPLLETSGRAAHDRLLDYAHRLVLHEVGTNGNFYLPRRDELCVLFDVPVDDAIHVLDGLTRGLNELDQTGMVRAEAGIALIPDEATHPLGALERADRRILPGEDAGRGEWLDSRRGRREEHLLALKRAEEQRLEEERAKQPPEEQLRLAN